MSVTGRAAVGGGVMGGEPAGDAVLRLRLAIAYDGTEFSGWAKQPDRRTVQGEIERALGRVLRLPQPPQTTVAGRTDAGVHARGQVAHCDVPADAWRAVSERVPHRLARALPGDVRVREIGPAPAGFDARFSALTRRYGYRVCDDAAGGDPLRRRDTYWHPRGLDPAAMNEAAASLVGEHDFAAYCRKRDGATTIRRLLELNWRRDTDGLLVATVRADAFCHNMVRALVGAMIAVGEGRRARGWPAEVLAGGVRDSGVPVMPAHALCLEEVRYPPDDELAARAALTRRVRTLSMAESVTLLPPLDGGGGMPAH